ncbi:MAG: hypothetical protein U0S36_06660 [Candidatus Nanopelagicales bacterium]
MAAIDPYIDRHPEAAYITGLVRFTDKATRDYEDARALFGHYIESRGLAIMPLFRGLDALGDSIVATHVGIEFSRSLVTKGIGQRRFIPDRQARTDIRYMRNHVLHAVEKLGKRDGAEDKIRPEDAKAPWPEERRIVYGQVELQYATLASAIRMCQRQSGIVVKTRARVRPS